MPLSAVVAVPKGAERSLLLRELRRFKVRVITPKDDPTATAISGQLDLLLVSSDLPTTAIRGFLGPRKSDHPQVILVEMASRTHRFAAHDNESWCLHRPLQACIVRSYIRSVIERKRLIKRLKRLQHLVEISKSHYVDDLWFSIFDRLKQSPGG